MLLSTLSGLAFGKILETPGIQWNYNNNGHDWNSLFPSCAGKNRQSPINFSDLNLIKSDDSLSVEFSDAPDVNISNNGHSILLSANPKQDMGELKWYDASMKEEHLFDLLQMHFHSPAEHTFDSVRPDLELHMVYRERDTDDESLAVMSLTFNIHADESLSETPVGTEYYAVNNFFNKLDKLLPNETDLVTSWKQASPVSEMIQSLFPLISKKQMSESKDNTVKHFYRYDGSLTTPPCTEDVLWFVSADKPIILSKKYWKNLHIVLNSMSSAKGGNFREITDNQNDFIEKDGVYLVELNNHHKFSDSEVTRSSKKKSSAKKIKERRSLKLEKKEEKKEGDLDEKKVDDASLTNKNNKESKRNKKNSEKKDKTLLMKKKSHLKKVEIDDNSEDNNKTETLENEVSFEVSTVDLEGNNEDEKPEPTPSSTNMSPTDSPQMDAPQEPLPPSPTPIPHASIGSSTTIVVEEADLVDASEKKEGKNEDKDQEIKNSSPVLDETKERETLKPKSTNEHLESEKTESNNTSPSNIEEHNKLTEQSETSVLESTSSESKESKEKDEPNTENESSLVLETIKNTSQTPCPHNTKNTDKANAAVFVVTDESQSTAAANNADDKSVKEDNEKKSVFMVNDTNTSSFGPAVERSSEEDNNKEEEQQEQQQQQEPSNVLEEMSSNEEALEKEDLNVSNVKEESLHDSLSTLSKSLDKAAGSLVTQNDSFQVPSSPPPKLQSLNAKISEKDDSSSTSSLPLPSSIDSWIRSYRAAHPTLQRTLSLDAHRWLVLLFIAVSLALTIFLLTVGCSEALHLAAERPPPRGLMSELHEPLLSSHRLAHPDCELEAGQRHSPRIVPVPPNSTLLKPHQSPGAPLAEKLNPAAALNQELGEFYLDCVDQPSKSHSFSHPQQRAHHHHHHHSQSQKVPQEIDDHLRPVDTLPSSLPVRAERTLSASTATPPHQNNSQVVSPSPIISAQVVQKEPVEDASLTPVVAERSSTAREFARKAIEAAISTGVDVDPLSPSSISNTENVEASPEQAVPVSELAIPSSVSDKIVNGDSRLVLDTLDIKSNLASQTLIPTKENDDEEDNDISTDVKEDNSKIVNNNSNKNNKARNKNKSRKGGR